MIAKTFARIFYRNAINIGLPILECEAASNGIDAGDEVEVNFDTGVITNITKGQSYQAEPFPEFNQSRQGKPALMGQACLRIKAARRKPALVGQPAGRQSSGKGASRPARRHGSVLQQPPGKALDSFQVVE